MKKNSILLAMFISAQFLYSSEIPIKDGDSIAFLGDSITYLGYKQKPTGYIHLVIEGLKQAKINVTPISAGIGGNTTRDMLKRIDKDVISKKPTWMTLNSGINDSGRGLPTEEFRKNIRAIVNKADAAGIKVILMTTTIGAGEDWKSKSKTTKKCLEYCEEFRKLAKERNLILVDLNTMMRKELAALSKDAEKGLKISFDGTHFNGLGNQLIAAEILRTLEVPENDISKLRKRWNTYPKSVGMPKISVNDYLKLKKMADLRKKTFDSFVSELLIEHANTGDKK